VRIAALTNKEKIAIVNRVSVVSILWNIILSAIKVLAGLFAHSHSIMADGIHSLSDVFTTVIALVSVRMASKDDDDDHPYGHEKIEPVMSKLLATVLIITALFMGYGSLKALNNQTLEIPGRFALYAALVSIVIKEWMYHYTVKAAKKIESNALKADAWHHRSDALSSIGSFIGIGGALLGFTVMDAIAGIVISLVIIQVGVKIYLQSVKELLDTAADPEVEQKLQKIIYSVEGVQAVDMMKTRQHGNRIYVDVEIAVDSELVLWKAHEIAEEVHDKLEHEYPKVKHCMVHVNPFKC